MRNADRVFRIFHVPRAPRGGALEFQERYMSDEDEIDLNALSDEDLTELASGLELDDDRSTPAPAEDDFFDRHRIELTDEDDVG